MKKIFLLTLLVVIFISGCTGTVGGDRDSHGCLGPAGYTYNETLKVCLREWEIGNVSGERIAIGIVAESIEQYGLTVESVDVARCPGCFVIHFNNPDYQRINITLANWQVIENAYTEVHGYHILVATEVEALDLKTQIDNEFDFGELAKLYSTCPSGQSGGDLGWFKRGAMVLEFENAAFDLEVGEVSIPVQTQFGWHLILVTEKR
ncbi:MAG: peptidylprolyl isomerase [Nanoarchaeota archaeon]|nr:peptidylprolyl isomerase [Nanoarchaeota archaeon]